MFYKDQLLWVSQQKLASDESIRVDCPNCGGKKTLSISFSDGSILWNCFKASCHVYGRYHEGRNIDQIKSYLKHGKIVEINERKGLTFPKVQGCPFNYPNVISFLEKNNCIKALKDGAVKISYSPADNRVLFFNPKKTGAVGKCLDRKVKPKWKLYGEIDGLFTVGNKGTPVIVEDVPSACAIYSTNKYHGIALLGTHLTNKTRTLVKKYEKVILALDKDASRKTLKLKAELQGHIQVIVKFLQRDLKEQSNDDIIGVLENEAKSNYVGGL